MPESDVYGLISTTALSLSSRLFPFADSQPPVRIGITAKLFLSLLAACALLVAVNALAGRLSFERGFLGYLNDQNLQRMHEIAPRLQDAYAKHGNWEFLRDRPRTWFHLLRPPTSDAEEAPLPVSDQTGALLRLALLDGDGRLVIGNPDTSTDALRVPLRTDGRTVGWLAMVPFERAIAAGDVRFYEAQLRAWWMIGLASVAIAAGLAWGLSRALLRRVKGLAQAIHRLARGDFSTRIARGGDDELAELGRDIDRLAEQMEHTEHNRRSFMADISHELRTPLAVLRAELEAIQDGIRPMTPASLAPLQGQVQQLGKLVEDLHELAVTQTGEMSYRFEVIDLGAVLLSAVEAMRGRFANTGLRLDAPPTLPPLPVEGDERRLAQLFANLLENALRYTAAGGRLQVLAERDDTRVRVRLQDSAPGVPADKRERLFERFYRVDDSRNRASGGSGLGLAICRNIVQAHGGWIEAQASPLGGLAVVLELPLRPPAGR